MQGYARHVVPQPACLVDERQRLIWLLHPLILCSECHCAAKSTTQCDRDGRGKLLFEGEEFRLLSLKNLAVRVCASATVNHLHCDTNGVAGLLNAPFNNRPDAEAYDNGIK